MLKQTNGLVVLPLILCILIFGTACGSDAAISENDQPASIETLEELSEHLDSLAASNQREANKIDDLWYLGTLLNELDVKEHRCYILGNILGISNSVSHLTPQYTTHLARDRGDDPGDWAYSLRVDALSMNNFTFSLDDIKGMSEGQHAIEWNLDCSGQLEIRTVSMPQPLDALISIIAERKAAWIQGTISEGTYQRFKNLLDSNPGVTHIFLGSEGGNIEEAILIGSLIRERNLTVALSNACYAECLLVFAGGTSRLIWKPYYALGFNRFRINGKVARRGAPVYDSVGEYLEKMGINSTAFFSLMFPTPYPNDTILAPGEYTSDPSCRIRLTTWIQHAWGDMLDC